MKPNQPDNDGSVYEYPAGTGRWWAQLRIDGRLVRRRASTERAAHAKLRELHAIRDKQLQLGEDGQTVRQWLEHWLATRAHKLKPKTLEGYRDICAWYIYPHLGDLPLSRLNPQRVERWLSTLRTKGLTESTLANAYRRLRTALEIAVKQRIIAYNPVASAEAPAPGRHETIALDDRQIDTLLRALEAHRLYPFYVIASLLGLRQAELIGLRWPHVALDGEAPRLRVSEQLQRVRDAKTGKRQVVRQTPKTDAGARSIPLSPELVAILRRWKARQAQERLIIGKRWTATDLVFSSEDGGPLSPSNLRRHLRATLNKAGLPQVTFHSLRHSAGSVMLKHKVDLVTVSKILGHSSPAVTARIYAHSFEESRRQAVETVSAALLRRA